MLKNMIKILGVIFVAGLLFVAIGLGLGAGKSAGENNKGSEREIVTEVQKNIEKFDSIKVDAISSDVMIFEDSDYGFEAQNSYGAKINWTVENGVLTIEENTELNFDFDIGFFDKSVENYIKIYVPKDTTLKGADISCVSGDTKFLKVKGDNIKLKLTSGDVVIEQCDFNKLEVSSSSGDVDIENSRVKKSDLDLISGDAKYENVKTEDVVTKSTSGDFDISGEVANSVNVELVSGDSNLNLKGKEEDYSFDIKSTSSEIRIGENIFEDKVSIQKGNKQIKIDCISGEVEVDFS